MVKLTWKTGEVDDGFYDGLPIHGFCQNPLSSALLDSHWLDTTADVLRVGLRSLSRFAVTAT